MVPKTQQDTTNREVKSSAFTTLFGQAENAAQLYAALNEEKVSPEDIAFTTLQGVLFMVRKNDLAFVAKKRVLVISEHQSTVNANMPLRDIIYYGRTMEKLVEPRDLYKTNTINIPTPEFLVFYNGDRSFPPEKILKLSDAFLEQTDSPMLELKVKIININLPVNHPILSQCRPLYEYSWFIQQIKTHLREGINRDDAIISAMTDCRKEGILTDFLREHGTEAVNMLFTEFNMEDALEVRGEEKFAEGRQAGTAEGRQAGMAEGRQAGMAEGRQSGMAEGKLAGMAEGKAISILELLDELGQVPCELKETILNQTNPDILTQWLKLAAKAKDFSEFV